MTSTPLEHALELASRGFYVFPVKRGKKTPLHEGWQEEATRDPETIRNLWGSTSANVGIFTGRYQDNRALIALDIDVKHDKRGDESLLKLELDGFDLPQTLTHETPSKGQHLIFAVDAPVRQGTDVLGNGIDVRSAGGYLVGPGSEIDGKSYRQVNGHQVVAEAPAWLVERLGKARVRTDTPKKPLPGVDPARARERAIEYLKAAPGVDQGARGSTAYKIAARLKDFGCSLAETFSLMDEFWAEKCGPPMPMEDLADSVDHAYRYGQEPQGSAAPEAAFHAESEEEEEEGEPVKLHPLEELNRHHAFVLYGGSGYVLWDTHDEHGKPVAELLSLQAFHDLHAAEVWQVSNKKSEPLTKAWMTWKGRRTYRRMCFAPGESLPADYYNLWQGWAVTPRPGDWSLMRAHIRNVICSGDPRLDRYVMGWLALAVQKPGVRAEVALVLRGGRGVGKGVLGNALCSIFGRHGLHLTNPKHMIGPFNGHLRETAFIFADESFWAGDRQHESVLKGLVTEPEFVLESKGKDAVRWPNRLHLLMASNDTWVVPAGVDERRFCVIEVSPVHRQDHDYFGALMSQMESGGLEAMLHDLLAYDVTGFQIRDVPDTKALLDQKTMSLRGPERWLREVLDEAAIWGHSWEPGERLTVPKGDVYGSYVERSRRTYGEHHPQTDGVFWKTVRSIMESNGMPLGDSRPNQKGIRVQCVTFPQLQDARAAFNRHIGGSLDWAGAEESPPKNGSELFG